MKNNLVVFYNIDDTDIHLLKINKHSFTHKSENDECESEDSETIFTIPKNIPDAELIAKHVTHSLIKGDMGHIYVGTKFISNDGEVILDNTIYTSQEEAVKHIRLSLKGFDANKQQN